VRGINLLPRPELAKLILRRLSNMNHQTQTLLDPMQGIILMQQQLIQIPPPIQLSRPVSLVNN
jgi:hypothetical protein